MRRRLPEIVVSSLAADDLSLEGWDVVLKRERAIKPRMAWVDSLPKELRVLANGIPTIGGPCGHSDLMAAVEAGCKTQEDAEEWFRSIVGRTVLGFD